MSHNLTDIIQNFPIESNKMYELSKVRKFNRTLKGG